MTYWMRRRAGRRICWSGRNRGSGDGNGLLASASVERCRWKVERFQSGDVEERNGYRLIPHKAGGRNSRNGNDDTRRRRKCLFRMKNIESCAIRDMNTKRAKGTLSKQPLQV